MTARPTPSMYFERSSEEVPLLEVCLRFGIKGDYALNEYTTLTQEAKGDTVLWLANGEC